MIISESLQLPRHENDVFEITSLDLVSTLLRKYPYFAKRLNVPTIGKLMAERGFEVVRRGKNKTTCYVISAISPITKYMDEMNGSWELLNDQFTNH